MFDALTTKPAACRPPGRWIPCPFVVGRKGFLPRTSACGPWGRCLRWDRKTAREPYRPRAKSGILDAPVSNAPRTREFKGLLRPARYDELVILDADVQTRLRGLAGGSEWCGRLLDRLGPDSPIPRSPSRLRNSPRPTVGGASPSCRSGAEYFEQSADEHPQRNRDAQNVSK